MLRYYLFAILFAGYVMLFIWALSDLVFGTRDARRFFKRLFLIVVWPVAICSDGGRKFLVTSIGEN